MVVGCKIPADMRMIEMLTDQLRVDQAILTGIFIFPFQYHYIINFVDISLLKSLIAQEKE